jgi:hypothetical protein
VGHYCPPGTVNAVDYSCPPGTFTNSSTLVRQGDCTVCPERYYCPYGSNGTHLPCFAGYVCPPGTGRGDQVACLPGTYSSNTSLADVSECLVCPAGHFCIGGKTTTSGPCAAGYYCPIGTKLADDFPCAAGTFSPLTNSTDQSECFDCIEGSYCPAGSAVPIPCNAGSYSNVTRTTDHGPTPAWPTCVYCPEGHYCPTGTINPFPCPVGFVSRANASSCFSCPPGYYCDTVLGTAYSVMLTAKYCPAGMFCSTGMSIVPTMPANPCPPSHYCPQAAPSPIPCPPGSYNPLSGQPVCQVSCHWFTCGTCIPTLCICNSSVRNTWSHSCYFPCV